MKNERGSILALTLVIFAVLMILGISTLSLAINENKQAIYHQNKKQAYYIARSGAEATEAAILSIDKEEEKEGLLSNLPKDIQIENMEFENGSLEYVNLKMEDGELIIESKAKVGNAEETLTKVLGIVENDNIGQYIGIEYGIFFTGNLKVEKQSFGNVNKDLKIGTSRSESDVDNMKIPKSVREKITTGLNITYPLPKLPDLPEGLEISNDSPVTSISSSVQFTGPDVQFNGLTINTNNHDIDIIVKKVTFLTSKEIQINGTGKVRLFVKKGMQFNNQNDINKGGKPNQLEIYYYGEELEISENINICANIFVDEVDIIISKPGNLDVHGFIYAPESSIKWYGNGSVNNIIGNTIIIGKDPKINKDGGCIQLPFDFLDDGSENNGITFSGSYYK